MPAYTPHSLLNIDFDIRNITVQPICFSNGIITDYSIQPRSKNLLHLITSGSRKYYIDNTEISLQTGSLLLIPDQTHYVSQACCLPSEQCSGIGICFDIFLPNGCKLALKPDIYHDWSTPRQQYENFFSHLQSIFHDPLSSILETKTLLFRLFYSLLIDMLEITPSYSMVKPAIDYMKSNYNKTCPVKTYADICQISESYFRKKFMECTGMSPIDYRNKLRFQAAKRLYQEDRTIKEIAEITGFCDDKHFTKSYKRANGTSIQKDLIGYNSLV